MPREDTWHLSTRLVPATPPGTVTTKEISLDSSLVVAADTDTVAEIRILWEDYDGSGTKPTGTLQLDANPITLSIANSGSGTDRFITEKVNGYTDDFSVIRGLIVKLCATDPDSPASGKGVVTLGDLATAGNFDALRIPIEFDSTLNLGDGVAFLIPFPSGFTWATGYPLVLTIHAAANLTTIVQVAGK